MPSRILLNAPIPEVLGAVKSLPKDIDAAAEPQSAKLSLSGVRKQYGTKSRTVTALESISLDVAEGEFVCLLGPSGCGKSTLLNIVAGLESPDSGSVVVDGVPVSGPGRDRMVMFQEHALFPWLTVMGNVLFALNLKPGLETSARRSVATYFLSLVGLESAKDSYLHELSGGMRQRVALARALAPNPRILLMDEPFAALDAMTRENLYGDLQRIHAQRNKTILFVTHNVREAVCLGDRVVVLAPNPGRIRSIHTIQLPKPRQLNSPELSLIAQEITESLKGKDCAEEGRNKP